ncbi:MAG TPA: hypothetical protein DDZ11_01530, partial [Lentisphaeria bacterium]|nr:hypothetical protein [Lentisphaeria bacterium]
MTQNRADGTMTQQMRIRYFVMNLIYHNTGKSVKVPSTRELAKRFGIARSTIQLAFEQLIKEGYLVCRQGAATMTNPLSHFVLQPETRNPLIGVKLYEGDAFYYGANFWRAISSVATELTERGFNIRLLMNAATTPESIDREVHESYLDGMILIDTGLEYINAARQAMPCVVIANSPLPDLPAQVLRSQEQAIRHLSRLLHTRNCTRGINVTNPLNNHDDYQVVRRLAEYNPDLAFRDLALEDIRKEMQENPPDVIVHFEQYAEILQKLVDESGRDILLVSRKAPVRDQYYNGYYFDFPMERMGRTAVDMLETLLAGQKSLPVRTIEAELKT